MRLVLTAAKIQHLVTMMSNKKPTMQEKLKNTQKGTGPSAKNILDTIQGKSTGQPNPSARLRNMLKQNGPVKIQTPFGSATISEAEEPEEREDTRLLEHPRTVREALEIAFQVYEDENDNGGQIYSAITGGEKISVSKANKDLAKKCFAYFGHYLFDKKLKDPEELSEWENEVAKLVSTPSRGIMRKQVSLTTTLPRFYNINITKLKLMDLKTSVPDKMFVNFDTTLEGKTEPLISTLRFIESFTERNTHKNVQSYIFSANYDNSYIIRYKVDRNDNDKIRFLDFILEKLTESNGVFQCQMRANSQRFAGDFRCLEIQEIKFIS